MKKILYAYFGKLGIFDEDIPGHSFYQIGLLDAIRDIEGDCKIDFYSYLPTANTTLVFPDDELGKLNISYFKELVDDYDIPFHEVTNRIIAKGYDAIYLKARFRNLSTLAKGLFDAQEFEDLIRIAASIGIPVYILDTDLSLPTSFIESDRYPFTIKIPSIDMPGIGRRFANDCLSINTERLRKKPKLPSVLYYGNLDFKNYKAGHAKNPIIVDLLNRLDEHSLFNGSQFMVTHAGKPVPDIKVYKQIPRTNRLSIWHSFAEAAASINISKDLYIERGFLPARTYEAAMFGTVTVSYSDKSLHPAMSFTNVEQAIQQLTYLSEISSDDYISLYSHQVEQLINKGNLMNK
jgi:hypothetical protein